MFLTSRARRMERASAIPTALFLCVLAFFLALPGHAQTLYYDADGTISSDISGNDVLIGSVNTDPFTVNIANGAVVTQAPNSYIGVRAYNQSRVNITGGYVQNLQFYDDSQVTVTGGYTNYIQLYNNASLTASGGIINSVYVPFNGSIYLSAGSRLDYLSAYGTSVTRNSGGTLSSVYLDNTAQFAQSGGHTNYLTAYGASRASVTGGSATSLTSYGTSQVAISGGSLTGDYYSGAISTHGSSQATLSGGNVFGDLFAYDTTSQIQVLGSGLTVTPTSSDVKWDGYNLSVGNYATLSGTLADGSAINRSVYYSAVSGDDTQMTFAGAGRGADLDLHADSSLPGIASSVNIHTDAGAAATNVIFEGTAQVGRASVYDNSALTVNGAHVYGAISAADSSQLTVNDGSNINYASLQGNAAATVAGGQLNYAYLYNNSSATVTGGSLYDVYAYDASQLTLDGTETLYGAYLYGSSQLTQNAGYVYNIQTFGDAKATVNGGTGYTVNARGNSQIAVNGGSYLNGTYNSVGAYDTALLTVNGSGLTATSGAATTRWDYSYGMYSGSYTTLTGTLNDGSAVNASVFAKSYSGGDTSLAFAGADRAPDLYQTASGGVTGLYSNVTVGRDQNNSVYASPTVTLDAGAHVGNLFALNSSKVTLNGAQADGYVQTYNASKVTVNAGQVNTLQTQGGSSATINGGQVNYIYPEQGSTVYMHGGSAYGVNAYDASTFTMDGGSVGYMLLNGNSLVNLLGGGVSSVYFLSGQFNIYGTDISLLNPTAGSYNGYAGTNYSLTGTLSAGDALSTSVFLADGVTFRVNAGATQDNPYLPPTGVNGVYTFNGVPSGLWFDPPVVDAYQFAMTDGNKFSKILDFPTGFSSTFGVKVGGVVLGSFSPGQEVDFSLFGFAGGVTRFSIFGIDPDVDAGNPNAFPIKLAFNSAFGSFTMSGVGPAAAAPEPGTLALLGCALLPGAALLRRRS